MASYPLGLGFCTEAITPEMESQVIQWLDSRTWSTELSRRTQHFGYGYGYKNKSLTPGEPLSGPILTIANLIRNAGFFNPTQCIVNEYMRSQGIAAHIDNTKFGDKVVGISISADGVMIFTRGAEKVPVFLPRRSMILMSGEARYQWKHEISKLVTYVDGNGNSVVKPADYRRISLTYRELA